MRFRALLLLFSFTMIGFCLTLYFQSEPSVQTVRWDHYGDLHYNEERSHSLKDLNAKTSPYQLEHLVSKIYEKNRLAGEKTRIMEIGSGNGRVIMELKKQFPEVEFYGINKEKTHTFYRRESYVLTALKFDILSKTQLELMELPYVVFQDLDFAARLPYAENKFDLIFSQNTIRHIKYKFELFNEILRVLKPNGLSIHTDLTPINVYDKGVILPFKEAIAEFRRREINIRMLENPRTLYFKKKTANVLFPVLPHQPVPATNENLSKELRRPDMGYNIKHPLK